LTGEKKKKSSPKVGLGRKGEAMRWKKKKEDSVRNKGRGNLTLVFIKSEQLIVGVRMGLDSVEAPK